MNPCSEEECYNKLDNMILNSFRPLRKIFKDRWKSVTGEEWADDAFFIRRLLKVLGETAQRTGLHFQKSSLEWKSVTEWDMPLLTFVLQNFPPGWRHKEQEVTATQNLKNLSDVLAYHDRSKRIPESEFQANVSMFRNSLQSLGVAEQEVNKIIDEAVLAASMEALNLGKDLHQRRAEDFLKDSSIEKLKKLFDSRSSDETSWGGGAQKFTWEMMVAIIEKAKEGSKTALRILQTFDYGIDLEDLLKLEVEYSDKQKMEIVDILYEIAQLNYQHVILPEELNMKMERIVRDLFEDGRGDKGEIDMKVRYCVATCTSSESTTRSDQDVAAEKVEILKEGVERYPDNVHYHIMLASHLNMNKKFRDAYSYARQGLKRFPRNAELLFCQGSVLRNLGRFDESTETFREFQKVAAKDDQKVPEAYYKMSCNALALRKLAESFIHFRHGHKAEEDQLPCYLPYESSSKDLAPKLLVKMDLNPREETSSRSSQETEPSPAPQTVLERKKYLNTATRMEIILEHRQHLKTTESLVKSGICLPPTAVAPKLKQTAPKDLSLLKPFTVSQMDRSQDQIFENRILELTIMDDPNPNYEFITVVAEDGNGDMIRVYVYNVDRSKETMDHYRAGCRIAIMNPYIRIGAICGTSGTRVDDPKCIVFKEKVENMCRFCGEEGASRKCSRCKRPYCSKECQTLDWKMFNHKLICPIKY